MSCIRFCLLTNAISANQPTLLSDLLLVGQLFVLLGQDLGQVQVAHLWVDFSIFGSFLHEEAKVRCQWLLREIWMSLKTRAPGSSEEANTEKKRKSDNETDQDRVSPSVSCLCKDSLQIRWHPQ